jgi:hypothetical protein
MKFLGQIPAALLFATLLSPALADEYQDAVGKAFPGFQILGPSEIKLDKDLDPKLYEKVKDRPGLILGRFNSDQFMDFAALIRGSRLIHIPEDKANRVRADDYYEGYLVVCLGRSQGGYECTKLETDPLRIHLPYDGFLEKFSPGTAGCTSLGKPFKAPKRRRDLNVLEEEESNVDIRFDTDAIALFDSMYFIYLPQGRGMYRKCEAGH